ncbi:MAG: hypothetical protein AAF799_20550 [Myxococcota bacterium]
MTEARIDESTNILLVLGEVRDSLLAQDFCGTVVPLDAGMPCPDVSGKTVYLCGDSALARGLERDLAVADRVSIIEDPAHHDGESGLPWPTIDPGRVPIRVHGMGVLYRRFFDPRRNYFRRIQQEHEFQSLTESTKPGKAHRTGIYLTPVKPRGDALHFRLLRCSSNFSGPTENFRAHDRHIVDALNQEAARVFAEAAPLNHVLAQIYCNTPATETTKQTKAKIKGHADKTKDMPPDAIMAFCTFYDGLDHLEPLAADPFDYGRKRTSGLTRLQFRLKATVAQQSGCTLPPQFSVTLYPGSVFLMPLSTNRLYTHEVRPSQLDAAMLPTRLGYVVRCSNRFAVHEAGTTFIDDGEVRIELAPPTTEGMAALRTVYAEENRTDAVVDYGQRFPFSMNKGDYVQPRYHARDEFRRYELPLDGNPFDALLASVRLEDVTKGRQGAVLVEPDHRSVPIVRTTTKYGIAAQCFSPAHARLARQIEDFASLRSRLNNALFELYGNAYAKMGMHSDQAQDLAPGSSIAVFSCYRDPAQATPPRALVITSKDPEDGETFQVPLLHNHVVVFSLDTNRRFKHKIVLDRSHNPPDNQWLGLTFRTSATFVRPHDDGMAFDSGEPLTLATEDERREFHRLRGRENREVDFVYPRLTYTISRSDLLLPSGTTA